MHTQGNSIFAELLGNTVTNEWEFITTTLAQKQDIPDILEALPNPNALTINGTKYDGSTAVDMTETINAMVEAKLQTLLKNL